MKPLQLFRIVVLMVIASGITASPEAKRLCIGVGLLPYYSYVKNVVRDKADVVPMIEAGSNTHGYRVGPNDIKRALGISVVVVNGVGHDEFVFDILKGAGIDKKVTIVYANKDVALIPQSINSNAVNSHTFVSLSASIQQIYTIANALAAIDADNAPAYRDNAAAYASRLRKMKAEYLKRIALVKTHDFRCATIHGGYSYLLQEFGFQVEDVIEPAHGVEPSASQLAQTIARIKKAHVTVLFSEADFPSSFVNTIQRETGVRVCALSHLSQGEYTADFFEKHMRANCEALCSAVEGAAK